MKKIIIFFIATHILMSTTILFCAGGYDDSVTLTNQQIATTANQRNLISSGSAGSSNGSNPTNCQNNCASTDPATAAMPYFIINWYATAGNSTSPLSSFTFPTNQVQGSGGFWVNNAILTIHLFPPSNIVSSSGVTPINNTTNSYAIMYTLKSMDGTIIQKALQYPSSAAGSTQTAAIMPISKGTPQIPTSFSISTIPAPTTPPANPAPTATVILDTIPFLPTNFATSSSITQQRILNAISPLSQKFLINVNSGSFTVTPLSATFDTEDGTQLVTSFAGQSQNIAANGGTKLLNLTVNLSDINQSPIQSLSFGQNNFTTQDLQNGLALNVHIFAPSTGSSQAQFYAFATLRTLDGLKLHKIQFPSFSTQPAELSINYGSATAPQFATIFLNSTASQNTQAIGLISPINLRCLLQQNSGGIFSVSML